MGRIIKELLAQYEKPQQAEIKVLNSGNSLDRYIENQKNSGSLEVVFGNADPQGNLYQTDENGVQIILTYESLKNSFDYYDPHIKNKFVGVSFCVEVSDIDKENKIVYVRSVRSSKSNTKQRLMGEIFQELKQGKKPIVLGKVISVSDSKCLVDIFSKGVLGICTSKNWSKAYTRYLKEKVKKGDIVKFQITSSLPKIKGKDYAFELNRANISDDPWEKISGFVQKDNVIAVKCIDRPQGKSFWWGVTSLAPDIEIMGDYNINLGGIYVSLTYKCKITDFEPENHKFKVVPFEIADADPCTSAAIKFIQTANVKLV